jgi:hypothetical protein
MATQNSPAIRGPLPDYPRRFQPSLTPPYHDDPKPGGPWSSQRGQGGSGDNYSTSITSTGEPRLGRNTPQVSPIQPPYRSPREAPVNPPVSLPPLRHLSRAPPIPSDGRSGNRFRVHSILKPQAELAEQQRALTCGNPQMESSLPDDTQHPHILPPIGSLNHMQERQQHPKRFQPLADVLVRPRYSEKDTRSYSLSRSNRPTGTINAQQSHFPDTRTRHSEVMTTQPALPTHRPRVNFPQSGSVGPTAMPPSSMQLMTIQSQGGTLPNTQVETQTASKGAHEKRKHSAGASARFRARRKEKEREASISIFRLEQNVRNSNEDAKYYRFERDYWRSIAMQAQPERHITRPPSPRLRRVSVAPSRAPSFTAGHGSEMREEERNVPRRTSSYHPAIGLHHIDVSAPSHESCGYPASTLRPVNPHHQQVHSAGPQPSAKRPAYRDSFPPEANRYEHRS